MHIYFIKWYPIETYSLIHFSNHQSVAPKVFDKERNVGSFQGAYNSTHFASIYSHGFTVQLWIQWFIIIPFVKKIEARRQSVICNLSVAPSICQLQKLSFHNVRKSIEALKWDTFMLITEKVLYISEIRSWEVTLVLFLID